MSVFPATSCENLPPSWRKLMTETASPIVDFYPSNFKIDLNGKKAAWMGVALLPFIDEERMHTALASVYPDLSEDEKERNSLGEHLLFVSKAAKTMTELLNGAETDGETEVDTVTKIMNFTGMGGVVTESKYQKDCKGTFCVSYRDPSYAKDYIFKAVRLANAKEPARVLKPEDFVGEFRPTIGMNNSGRRGYVGQAGHRMLNNAVSSAYGGHQAQGGMGYQAYGREDNRNNQAGKRNVGYQAQVNMPYQQQHRQ